MVVAAMGIVCDYGSLNSVASRRKAAMNQFAILYQERFIQEANLS